jgi:hypothetical protein
MTVIKSQMVDPKIEKPVPKKEPKKEPSDGFFLTSAPIEL